MVTTICPSCGTELRSRDEFAGWPVRCSHCGTICRLPGIVATAPVVPAMPPAASDLYCSICGKEIRPGQQWIQLADGVAGHSTCYEDLLPPVWQQPSLEPGQLGSSPSMKGAFHYCEPSEPPAANDLNDLWDTPAVAIAPEPAGRPLLPPVRAPRDGYLWQMIGLGIGITVVALLLIALLATVHTGPPEAPPAPIVIIKDADELPSMPARGNRTPPTAPSVPPPAHQDAAP